MPDASEESQYLESIRLLFEKKRSIVIFVSHTLEILYANRFALKLFESKDLESLNRLDISNNFVEINNKKIGSCALDENINWLQYINSLDDSTITIKYHDEANSTLKAFLVDATYSPNGYILHFIDLTDMEVKNLELETQANIDALTGLNNRKVFNAEVAEKINIFNTSAKSRIALIIFDIDHFKKVNDTFGHNIGDSVLVSISFLLKRSIKSEDLLARWGGEEFVILLPDTDILGARKMADRLRRVIENHSFEKVKTVTCSFGVTQVQNHDTAKEMIERADGAL